MAMDSVTRDLFDRIAKMEAMGVPNGDIAKATGLSDGRITQIQEEEEYKELLSVAAAGNLERSLQINEGWDSVEEMALATVVTHLNTAPDPDYALKAAALANKAARRNSGNRTLNPGNAAFAVINLNATFVEKVNAAFAIGRNDSGNRQEENNIVSAGNGQKQLPQKDSDFLPPSAVEKLLGAAQSRRDLVEVDRAETLEIGISGILEPVPI